MHPGMELVYVIEWFARNTAFSVKMTVQSCDRIVGLQDSFKFAFFFKMTLFREQKLENSWISRSEPFRAISVVRVSSSHAIPCPEMSRSAGHVKSMEGGAMTSERAV
jgi:hypothetical protein